MLFSAYWYRAVVRRVIVLLIVSLVSIATTSVAQAKTYQNCYQLTGDFPYGVAQGYYRVGTSNAGINRKTYISNKKLDTDRDGIACEVEKLQNPPTITTTTTPQTPLSDLQGFVATYGKSVVTITCSSIYGTSQGSGVSVNLNSSAEQKVSGVQSWIVTNHHVVENCITGEWKSRVVTIKAAGVEYVGHVWNWRSANADGIDIATITTTGVIPPVSSLFTVSRPQIGEVVVAIGSSGGIAGTAAQGAIAGISDTELLTTAQAGFGSSGGLLINKSGQMIGLIQGAVGLLLSAIPITRFNNVVYGDTATKIVW